MRILIPNHFPLQGSGSGIYTLNLAQELARMGHEVLVIVPDNLPLLDGLYPFPVEVMLFNDGEAGSRRQAEAAFNFPCFTTHPRSNQTFYDLTDDQMKQYVTLWRKHIGRATASFQPDIVHGHHVWVAPYVAVDLGLPTVISVHGTDLMGFRDGPRYRPMALAAAKGAQALIAISRQVAAETVATYQAPEEKVHLIWNGFDSDIFRVIPGVTGSGVLEELGIPGAEDGRPLVSFVGKFTDFKGIDVLLRAAARYERAIPGIRTLLVGHGQLFDEMGRLADDLGLQGVRFAGHQPQTVVARIYNAADVSVVPSRVEPFGLVAVEALACGTPVVATNEGGLPDFINSRVGSLVSVDDPVALADAIIAEVASGSKKTKGAYAARYASEDFSWAGQVAKIAELYDEVLGATNDR